MAETRRKLAKGQRLVPLPCEVTAEEKQQFQELAEGVSYGRALVWLMEERARLLEDRRMLARLLNECLNGPPSPAKAVNPPTSATNGENIHPAH
jgi:hypothetical protein